MTTNTLDSTTTSTDSAAAELVWLDPAALVIGANARLDPKVDKRFLASIRERGVLEPVVGYRDDDAQVVVLYGQRRTLAATATGRASVPVILVPRPAESDRLVDQVSENEHRAALSTNDRVSAYAQMAALGLSAAQIAKRAAPPRQDVQDALVVTGSGMASQAVARWEFLDLTRAAVIADFEDDPEAVKALVVAAQGSGFEHTAQRLRDARAEALARAQVAATLTAAGVEVVERPEWGSTVTRLVELTHEGESLTPDGHADCGGHAAYVTSEWVYPHQVDTDDPGDQDAEEDDAEDAEQDDAEDDDEGGQGVGRGGPSREWVAVYVCTDPAAHGHTTRYGGRSAEAGARPGPR